MPKFLRASDPEEESIILSGLHDPYYKVYQCTNYEDWRDEEEILKEINQLLEKLGFPFTMFRYELLTILSCLVADGHLCMKGERFII